MNGLTVPEIREQLVRAGISRDEPMVRYYLNRLNIPVVNQAEPVKLYADNAADQIKSYLDVRDRYANSTRYSIEPPPVEDRVEIIGSQPPGPDDDDAYSNMKIGRVANVVLRQALESGELGAEEISHMQTKEYSRRVFGIGWPLLVPENSDFPRERYYSGNLVIEGKEYRLCSQWFEKSRPLVLAWLERFEMDSNDNISISASQSVTITFEPTQIRVADGDTVSVSFLDNSS